ncbi:hypothetical protein G2W53_036427 [Senna tora]|uniref:Uncharacterized protein n=1 Tax=Senna tora TaxID=362788 RepID=A0A834T4Y0_9FABA|nr:hypothetical protein G2W53_036427 [Senna tora]
MHNGIVVGDGLLLRGQGQAISVNSMRWRFCSVYAKMDYLITGFTSFTPPCARHLLGGLRERAHHALTGYGNESTRSRSGESKHVTHIHLTRLHPIRQLPREAVEKVGHRQLKRVQPELHSGARPPTRPERNELEIAPLEIRHALLQEPRRPKGVRFVPRVPVPPNGPGVDHHARLLGNEVAGNLGVLRRLVEEQGDWRVEAQCLLQGAF